MNNKKSLFARFIILLVAALMAALPSVQASAALVKCRTDPIFSLSNGDVVTVILDINTDPSYIKEVSYILHVPAGVTLTSVEFTPGILGKKESYMVIQDSPDGFYTSDSLLKTMKLKSAVEVTSNMDVNSIYFQSATGYDNQNLIITLKTDTLLIPSISDIFTDLAIGSVKDDGKISTNDSTIVIVTTITE